jgi:hypothetical protein
MKTAISPGFGCQRDPRGKHARRIAIIVTLG